MDAPPLVAPDQLLMNGFVMRLPFPMARRVEDGSLVFWHTPNGLTFWIDINERDEPSDCLGNWKSQRSAGAQDELAEQVGTLLRYSYRLNEPTEDRRQPAFYGFVAQGRTEILLAAYFNAQETINDVLETWRSIGMHA